MGVDVLWFMPIHPIGIEKRKGTLGSYYAVQDYQAVNPEFGTVDDFKKLVKTAHKNDLKVILDWVPNHTAWDNVWFKPYPDYYERDDKGNFFSPFDWTDVVSLNYKSQTMREDMIAALKYWVDECDIDGYRMDVAGEVPDNFWAEAYSQVNKVKDNLFWLAEAERKEHIASFDAYYGWEFHQLINKIAKGERTANALDSFYTKHNVKFPVNFWSMNFTSNHDENTWNGTEYERMKGGAQTFAVLCYTVAGIPLIYNGQESAFKRRLAFFEKDQIDWAGYDLSTFYKTLNDAKHKNVALWNGELGGRTTKIGNSNEKAVYSFIREKDGNKVVVILNLTDQPQKVKLKGSAFAGNYKDIFSIDKKITTTLKGNQALELEAWSYQVLVKEK
jgi:glycosidase